MGVVDFIYSLTDTVKSYTPSLTSVYDYSVPKVNIAVPKLTGYLPDVESCAKIGQKLTGYLLDVESCTKIGQKLTGYLPDNENIKRLAWHAINLGVHEGVKFVPGGSFVLKEIKKSLPDQKKEELTKTLNTLQARLTMLEKQAAASGRTHKRDEIPNSDIKPIFNIASDLDNTINFQKPEDVIRIFMMKGFVGREINEQIAENLMVPGVGKYGK